MTEERREEKRYTKELKIEFKGIKEFLIEYSENISKGGMFIRSKQVFPVNTKLCLNINLPNLDKPISVDAVVVYSKSVEDAEKERAQYGMGIRFLDFEEGGKEQFFNYLVGLSKDSQDG